MQFPHYVVTSFLYPPYFPQYPVLKECFSPTWENEEINLDSYWHLSENYGKFQSHEGLWPCQMPPQYMRRRESINCAVKILGDWKVCVIFESIWQVYNIRNHGNHCTCTPSRATCLMQGGMRCCAGCVLNLSYSWTRPLPQLPPLAPALQGSFSSASVGSALPEAPALAPPPSSWCCTANRR